MSVSWTIPPGSDVKIWLSVVAVMHKHPEVGIFIDAGLLVDTHDNDDCSAWQVVRLIISPWT
eukprot:scaffold100591_cov39-Prasinocladus_malaysianus.AAC.1